VIHPDILSPEGWIIPQPVYEDAQRQFILDRQAAVPPNLSDVYYNTRKVTQAEIDSVQSWTDFLKPQWRGRMVTSMNPDTASGPPTYGWMYLGKSFFDPFIRQMNPTHLPGASGREVMDGLAQGKWDLVLFYGGGDVRGELGSLQELGLPVARLERTLKEGTVIDLQGGMGIFDQAPHPNAAQLWFNWLMSKEGQTTENSVTEEVGPRPSLRKDIPRGKVREDDYNLIQQLKPDQVHVASTSDPAYNAAKSEVTDFLRSTYTELHLYGY
jgi:ABC-type Fe3+ transport system substrate-binding protein